VSVQKQTTSDGGAVSGRRRQRRRKARTRPRLAADLRQVDWQAVDWARVDRRLARFDAGSLAVLLAAAADSPGGGHRLPSLTVLWLRCMSRPPAGAVIAAPAHLPQLLSAARDAAPQLRVLEDCRPADPRLLVRFPAAGQRFRVHPGSLLNPVLTLRSVAATAEAIDDFVLGRHGFRLTDLLEVALRYSDHQMGVLADTWPDSGLALDRPDPPGEDLRARVRRIARTPVTVTGAEVSAAAAADAEPGDWTAACEYPDRAAAAWRWATRPAAEMNVDLFPGAERLGAVLAAGALGRDWPVPAALVVSAVAVAAAVLAREAADDEQSARRMQEVTQRRALAAFGHRVAPAPAPDAQVPEAAGSFPLPDAPVAVIVPASRHAFAAGLASGLDLDSNPTKLIEIVEIGKQLLITRGSLTTFSIANDVEVLRHAAGHVRGRLPGAAPPQHHGAAQPDVRDHVGDHLQRADHHRADPAVAARRAVHAVLGFGPAPAKLVDLRPGRADHPVHRHQNSSTSPS
jgi:hypothetical protein